MKTEAEELILDAHDKGNKKTKQILEKSFPKLFKPFKNGGWIKNKFEDILIRITDDEKGLAYGFAYGNWTKEYIPWTLKTMPHYWQRATEDEVISAFKKEFEKRGFKEGVKFKNVLSGNIHKFYGLEFEHFFDEVMLEYGYGQRIYSNGYLIYKNGVFAEIVEDKKTIEQRLKAVEQFINELKY